MLLTESSTPLTYQKPQTHSIKNQNQPRGNLSIDQNQNKTLTPTHTPTHTPPLKTTPPL